MLLSKYILSRKDEIFDPRNIKVALVGKDPIGEAFGVKAFHRCQVNSLLRSQLIPASNDSLTDIRISTSSCSAGVSAEIRNSPSAPNQKAFLASVDEAVLSNKEKVIEPQEEIELLRKRCKAYQEEILLN